MTTDGHRAVLVGGHVDGAEMVWTAGPPPPGIKVPAPQADRPDIAVYHLVRVDGWPSVDDQGRYRYEAR